MSSSGVRLAFVSAPGSSIFMQELLDVVADSVERCDAEVVRHVGFVTDLDPQSTVFVVIPHEYFAVAGGEERSMRRRMMSFGVEHPGTTTFHASTACAVDMAAHFEISRDSVRALAAEGVTAHHFQLGYSGRWDHWHEVDRARSIDVTYMGTADLERVGTLARLGEDLSAVRTELFVPPHEPMVAARQYFLTGEEKWRLLSDARLMLNLHRAGKTAFEVVRALEAMCNGCVVLTEPSTDLEPFAIGEHLLVGQRGRLGNVARAGLSQPELLTTMASAAYRFVRDELDVATSASRMIDVATDVARSPAPAAHAVLRRRRRDSASEPPMAQWLPTDPLPLSGAHQDPARAGIARALVNTQQRYSQERYCMGGGGHREARVDVVCVERPGDGPIDLTCSSMARQVPLNLHVALADGATQPSDRLLAQVATCLTFTEPVGRGLARNRLLRHGTAPYVLVLDSGDASRPSVVGALVDRLDADPEIDVAYPIAQLGTDSLMNHLVPESRRLRTHRYLTRGYLARRSMLEQLGGFAEQPDLETFVDHDFWLRTARAQRAALLLRNVGIVLWGRERVPGLSDWDPVAAESLLRERVLDPIAQRAVGRGAAVSP